MTRIVGGTSESRYVLWSSLRRGDVGVEIRLWLKMEEDYGSRRESPVGSGVSLLGWV